MQDDKRNNEQAVAGTTDHRTLRNLQRTVKSVSAFLQQGGGYYQHLESVFKKKIVYIS